MVSEAIATQRGNDKAWPPPRLVLEIDVRELLAVVVAHDEKAACRAVILRCTFVAAQEHLQRSYLQVFCQIAWH